MNKLCVYRCNLAATIAAMVATTVAITVYWDAAWSSWSQHNVIMAAVSGHVFYNLCI